MPYAKNGDIYIYYEVEGEGTPLVMAHAGGESLNQWKSAGYVDALKNDFKLVLFDARGCGQSDKPHESSAYGPDVYKTNAADVIAVLDAMNISKTHYYGYSMGARTGYQLAVDLPDRFDSFILGSTSPFEWPGVWATFSKRWAEVFKLSLTDIEVAISKQQENREETLGRTLSADERDNLRNNVLATLERVDAEAMIASGEVEYKPLTVEDVAGISKPCLIYCGDADDFHSHTKKAAEHIQQSTFLSLLGHNHVTSFRDIDTVLPHVKEFLAKVSN